jgi:hypothetical protein
MKRHSIIIILGVVFIVGVYIFTKMVIYSKKTSVDRLLGIHVSNVFEITYIKRKEGFIGEINRMYYGKILNHREFDNLFNKYPDASSNSFDGGAEVARRNLIQFSGATEKDVVSYKVITYSSSVSIRKIHIMVLKYKNNMAGLLLVSD